MTTGLVWHERYMWHDTRHAAAAFPLRRLDRARHARREPAHEAAPQEPHGRIGDHAAAARDRAAHGHGRGDLPLPRALVRRPHQGALGRQRRRCGRADAVRAGLLRDRPALGGRRDRGLRRRARRRGRQRLRARAARPATTRSRARAWASASSATSPSRRITCAARAGSGAWRSSTGTSTTATARRARSTTIRACSRSRCTRTAASRSARGRSTTTARARARAPTSTSRCRAAAAAAPTWPPSSASSCPRSSASRPTSSSSRAASTPARWIRSARMQMHSAGYRELTKLMLGVAERLLRGPSRRRARGRLLVGLRAVLRARDRRGALGPRRAASRIRCSSSSSRRAATSSLPHEDAAIALCEPLVELVPGRLVEPFVRTACARPAVGASVSSRARGSRGSAPCARLSESRR